MKKILLLIAVVLGLYACESEKPDLIIEGQIKGLKKGKVYLQKLNDSTVVNLDSVSLYNSNQFKFEKKIEYPEIMFIQLQKDTINPTDNYVAFFADKGKVNINAELDQFFFAEIQANYPNQQEFNTYSKTMKRFNNQKLDLIKAEMVARKSSNMDKLDSVNKAYNAMNTRRSLFTVNFVARHPDLEMSPYLILNQAKYIQKPYLDTIYQKMDKKIQKSFYGKKLQDLIEND